MKQQLFSSTPCQIYYLCYHYTVGGVYDVFLGGECSRFNYDVVEFNTCTKK